MTIEQKYKINIIFFKIIKNDKEEIIINKKDNQSSKIFPEDNIKKIITEFRNKWRHLKVNGNKIN